MDQANNTRLDDALDSADQGSDWPVAVAAQVAVAVPELIAAPEPFAAPERLARS